MKDHEQVKEEALKNPDVKREYDKLGEEFEAKRKSIMNIKEQVAFNLFMKHETINDNNFIRSRKTWDKYKNSPSLQHYWDEAGTIIPMIRAECQREIARHLIKSSLWREIPTPTYSGDKNSTGGIVQLSDTYYLISENIIKQLESGTFEEGE